MKSVARMALENGMILADDVYSYQNDLIAKEGDMITKELIAKFSRYSVMCVDIKEPEDFAATRYERVRLSKEFKNFELVYNNNLNAYKYMIQSFLNDRTPVNTSYLLQIHDNIINCCSNEEQILDMLYHLMPSEDDLTYAHCLNAALISTVFGKWIGLNENELQLFTLCGFFYDIGKMKLPDSIIWKPYKLTDEEFEIVKTHTTLGYELLKNQNINEMIKICTLNHHERVDGSGYPNKLKGDAIDSFSKYIGIVDAYEAMTSARIYRSSLTPFQVIRTFEKQGFEKYDSIVLKTILSKIANFQIGRHIRLSNGVEGDILLIHADYLSSPLIKIDATEVVDLKDFPDIEIITIL